jgi:mono/diheme cytochrome c family protein
MAPYRMTIILGSAVVAAVVVAAGVVLRPAAQAETLLKPNDQATINAGAEIYAAQCASCHGENLEGQPNWQTRGPGGELIAPPHDETGHTWHHPDTLLFAVTKYGAAEVAGLDDLNTDMPIFESVLTDDEIIAVLSYIKSTWPEEIRERHDVLNERAASQ